MLREIIAVWRQRKGRCATGGYGIAVTTMLVCLGGATLHGADHAVRSGRASSPNTNTEWTRWVVVNVCPTRIYGEAWKSDAKRLDLIRDFDPDVCDWWSGVALNRGDVFTVRGVATCSASEYEYQEAIGPMWGFARKMFGDNGMAIRENGSWARFPKTKYGGAHMMCLNASKWRVVVEQGMMRAAGRGTAVSQDNIGCPVSKYHPGFCDWCNRRFVEYMRGRFSTEQLAAMGVDDLSEFQLRPYLSAKRAGLGLPFYQPPLEGADPEALIRDPIVHEYIRFQYRAMLDIWRRFAAAAKREARHLGRPEPALYGNQAGVAGQTPLATMLCPYVDVVWVESSRCWQPCFERLRSKAGKAHYKEGVFVEGSKRPEPRQAWSTLNYKVGRAAAYFRKPVWTIQYPAQWYGEKKRTPAEIVFAEAYANGGVPVLLFAPSITQKADTAGLTWQVGRDIAQFVHRRRELFVDRSSVADTALVLSLPSLLWRGCTSLRVQPVAHRQCFTAAARRLEESHVPYEVIVLGHPDFYDDRPNIQRLRTYRTVIVPGADCLSDRHVEALAAFAKAGGRLVLLGEVGTCDEELRARRTPAFSKLVTASGAGTVVRCTVDTLPASPGARLIETDLPATVWLNVWRHGAGPMTSVQMVNYDADIAADRVHPVPSFRLRLRSLPGKRWTTALYACPGVQDRILPLTRHDGWVETSLPGLRLWGIVVFGAKDELRARAAAARARKWLERLAISRRIAPDLGAEEVGAVHDAERLLEQIQGRPAMPDFAGLLSRLDGTADYLQHRVEARTAAYTAAARTRREEILRVPAVRKFDFGEAGAATGWTEVSGNREYSPGLGYGWVGKARMTAVDHGVPDALHRDYLRNTDPATYLGYEARGVGNALYKRVVPPQEPATFRVDLPNGDYVVTIIMGSGETPGRGSAAGEGRTAMTCVDANGVAKLPGTTIRPGEFSNRAFRVRVTDGRLELRFHGASDGPFFHNTIEWLVNGVVIQRPDQPLTHEAETSLRRIERWHAATLREWKIIGPFADPDWTGMDREFGPECGNMDATARMWQAPDAQAFAVIPLDDVLGAGGGNVAFVATTVRCERPQRANLHFSTSQRGAAYVNGNLVHVDHVATGILLDECCVPIDLKAGRTSILIKTVSHWPGNWRVWAALTTPEGEPMAP